MKNDGGPAFPREDYKCNGREDVMMGQQGMSMRDYFAAKALSLGGEFFHNLGNGCDTPKTVVDAAYQIADAMLAARQSERN